MSLEAVVEKIRTEMNLTVEVPTFDPDNGNEKAKYLFLLEAPGPKAVKTGFISFENPDPTARNFRKLLKDAGIERSEIAVWNVVPWYIGNKDKSKIRAANRSDIQDGLKFLPEVLVEIPTLKYVILMGGAARKAHVFLSKTTAARIVSCHHTSNQVKNANPQAFQDNLEVLQFIAPS